MVDRFLKGARSTGLALPPRADGGFADDGAPAWGTPEDEREAFEPPPVDRVR
jgi:hypothetical protein